MENAIGTFWVTHWAGGVIKKNETIDKLGRVIKFENGGDKAGR